MCDGHLACQAVVGCWRQWVVQAKRAREIEGYTTQGVRDRDFLARRIAQLEEEIGTLRVTHARLQDETASQAMQLHRERDEAKRRSEQLEAVISQMGEVAGRVTDLSRHAMEGTVPVPPIASEVSGGALDELVRGALHQILADVDTRWVPSVNVPPSPATNGVVVEVPVLQRTPQGVTSMALARASSPTRSQNVVIGSAVPSSVAAGRVSVRSITPGVRLAVPGSMARSHSNTRVYLQQ